MRQRKKKNLNTGSYHAYIHSIGQSKLIGSKSKPIPVDIFAEPRNSRLVGDYPGPINL